MTVGGGGRECVISGVWQANFAAAVVVCLCCCWFVGGFVGGAKNVLYPVCGQLTLLQVCGQLTLLQL